MGVEPAGDDLMDSPGGNRQGKDRQQTGYHFGGGLVEGPSLICDPDQGTARSPKQSRREQGRPPPSCAASES